MKIKALNFFSSAFFFILIAAMIGGSTPVVAKYAIDSLGPFTLITLRFSFAVLALLPLVIRQAELSREKLISLIPVGLVGALNPILLFFALQFTGASFSALIYSSVPAMTAIYGLTLGGQKIETSRLIGILTGLFGVATIVLLPVLQGGGTDLSVMGNGLIFLAAIAFMAYGILSNKKQKEHAITPLALTFYFALITLVFSLPLTAFELFSRGLPDQISPIVLASTAYMGIMGTAASFLAYQYAIKRGSDLTASLFTYLQPIFGIGLAALFLGETITLPFVVGGILAVTGAQLASQRKLNFWQRWRRPKVVPVPSH